MRRRVAPVFVALLMAVACGNNTPATPTPPGNTPETITGRERLGWDQRAGSTEELATFRYAVYVDNVRSLMADVTCAATAGAAGFPCSGRLPNMSTGAHTLELAAFIEQDGVLESPRSQPLRVTVTGIAVPRDGSLASGDAIKTADGVTLQLDVLHEDLNNPTSLAIARDGRAFVGTADGIVILRDGKMLGPLQLTDGPALALDLSPTFDRDGHLYATQFVDGGFRTVRVTDMGGWLAQRMVILAHGPASADPTAALRFGPDRKLYLAYDDGGSADAAARMAEWRGKLLRMEADGRTPEDQAAASPVLFPGLASPRGFDWAPDGALWLAERGHDGVERLRVIASTSERPRRAAQRVSYVLPANLGASALAFYQADTIKAFSGDLLVAGRDGGYVLRIRFDPDDPQRPAITEKLLEGRFGAVRALTVGPDGAIYIATDHELVRLRGR